MVLMTKNRTLMRLVRNAYQRAQVTPDQILVVWNSRIYLHEALIVMESACPIYLDKIVEQLRIFSGDRPQPPGCFIWVRVAGNAARRWGPWKERRNPAPVAQVAGSEGQ